MGKILLLIAAVLLGVLAFLVITWNGEGSSPDAYDGSLDDLREDEVTHGPLLEAAPGPIRPTHDHPTDGTTNRPPSGLRLVSWIAGTVLDAATGRPIDGASIRTEPVREPCPRLPIHGRPTGTALDPNSSTIPMREIVNATTDEEGHFDLKQIEAAETRAADLFVFANGYVTGFVCQVGATDDLVVRLTPGKQIRGRVTNTAGHPVPGAAVMTMRPEGLVGLPGTNSDAVTDEDGRFVVENLADMPVVVSVDHAHYMAYFSDPVEPSKADATEELAIQLVPAWRVTFIVRSDDGGGIENPTLQWKTSGEPPLSELDLLTASPTGPPGRPNSEVTSVVIRLPCNRRTVDIQVKADGYLPWITTGEPLPPDGGEQTFQVTVERDMTVGTLRVHLKDDDGQPIHYAESNAIFHSPIWLGPRDTVLGAFVMEPSEILTLPSLKAGPYRIRISAPEYAPAEADVTVEPGGITDVEIPLAPPARLRVRFVAPERMMVHFRILKDGRPVLAFPEGQPTEQPTGVELPPLRATEGGEGLVLSGLAGGAHVVEVIDEDLVRVSRGVTLTPGETQEIEIEVQPR